MNVPLGPSVGLDVVDALLGLGVSDLAWLLGGGSRG